MNRLRDIWTEIVGFENLHAAYRAARRGKSSRTDVIQFSLELEDRLVALQERLLDGSWRPGGYRQFTVYERKPRVISAASFEDRVVHHAVMRVVEPVLDRRFSPDSFACRRGKGVHAALDQYQRLASRFAYVVHLDIRKYFPSIDHALLKAALWRRIDDRRTLAVIESIIDASPDDKSGPQYFAGDDLFTPLARRQGIPIGNLTSQFFANLYLDDFDHWLRQDLRVPGYVRYVDDFLMLADSAAFLMDAADAVSSRLASLRLRLHEGTIHVRRTSEKVPVLGFQISRTRRWLRAENGYRFRRRYHRMARRYAAGRQSLQAAARSAVAWSGHACHGETKMLRAAIFNEVVFRRGVEASPSAG